ncbi:fimbrial chaperone protein [Enterobacillus tribolii]|uniref:Fimbrial chaperone protein n=2 Tax=Enterobacillus tribolii TaxID=1487935 RepID=A0A370QEI9_9GAMM|nr:fimbrial chaperone protein [Enterobacillus tribolii]
MMMMLSLLHAILRPRHCLKAILAALVLLTSLNLQASIAIGLTRAIVTGDNNAGSVQILNEGRYPALIQVWIDNGIDEMSKTPEEIQVPFVINTPVFRLEGRDNRRIRIFYTGKGRSLPSDRESMFWLNVLEVPPKNREARPDTNSVQIAFHSRIKLFYRPHGIPAQAQEIGSQLIFTRLPSNGLQITNPTPFHITFMTLEIDGTSLTVAPNDMIAPLTTVTIPVPPAKKAATTGTRVVYSIIDDFGSTVKYEKTL